MRTEYKVGAKVKVSGTNYVGTVAEVRGALYRVDLDGRSGVVYFGASELASGERCVACKMACGDDRQLCLLVQDRNRTGDALEAFNDGAIFGALLAGYDVDEYGVLLEKAYDDAKKAFYDYLRAQEFKATPDEIAMANDACDW